MPHSLRLHHYLLAAAACLLTLGALFHTCAQTPTSIGVQGTCGVPTNTTTPQSLSRLQITKPGLYENLIIDGNGASGNLVKITADNVALRHCEIRNGSGNGIGIFGTNVRIENCRIHHMLNGTFTDQKDAHGISGRWANTIIRNCDISYTSGDSIQFDPDRSSSGHVTIENCKLWTGPLPTDATGFKAGQRPGENAIDTKTQPDGPACKLTIRNCHFLGWNQPAQISNAAALNLKENVEAEITRCLFQDNEIAFRVRGPGIRGPGAKVTISDCAIYNTQFGVRAEDKIEHLKVTNLMFGPSVTQRYLFINDKPQSGFQKSGREDAPDLATFMKTGFTSP